ncbi:MAG: hypothetical protein Q8K75_09065 [Chlamydiales bacterium]|nr:hypothetical protein [Chlamydiales bacterium]
MQAVDRICNYIPYISRPKELPPHAHDLTIAKVAAIAFAQLAVAAAVNLVITTYVAAPLSIAIATTFLTSMALNLAVELGKYACQRLGWIKTQDPSKGPSKTTIDNCAWYSQFSLVNVFGLSGPTIALHELGHYSVAKTLFTGAKPSIFVQPFQGGYTTFDNNAGLSCLGRLIGLRNSTAILIMGGVIATTLVATTALAASHFLKESHPGLSRFLELYGYVQLLSDLIYGVISAMHPEAMAPGDFCLLDQLTGIHPLMVVGAMVATTTAVKVALPRLCPKPVPAKLTYWESIKSRMAKL